MKHFCSSFSFLPCLALVILTSLSLLPLSIAFSSSSDILPRNGGKNRALFAAATVLPDPSNRDVQTKLPGVFWRSAKPKYVLDYDWILGGIKFWKRVIGGIRFFLGGGLIKFFIVLYATYGRSVPITIYDARAKEAEMNLSKAEFFDKYGFVILKSKSAMTAEGWEASDRDQKSLLREYSSRSKDGGAAYNKRMDDFRNEATPVKEIYAKEATELLKSILPRAKTIMGPAKGIRRSLGAGLLNAPAKVLHNDYGLIFDEVAERNPFFDFDKQRAIYEESEADEYMLVNLWRPIAPMSTPLRSLPLCFLDSSTLSKDDFVSIDSKSLGVTAALKNSPDHKFYYYPDMTIDEVIVFKQFHRIRNENSARMPVFHTAFADPAADENTEGRISFEYRVGLLL